MYQAAGGGLPRGPELLALVGGKVDTGTQTPQRKHTHTYPVVAMSVAHLCVQHSAHHRSTTRITMESTISSSVLSTRFGATHQQGSTNPTHMHTQSVQETLP